jgi:hypothetical protein
MNTGIFAPSFAGAKRSSAAMADVSTGGLSSHSGATASERPSMVDTRGGDVNDASVA